MDSLISKFSTDAARFDQPVLVTGAGGCIGSWVLAILVRAGVPAVAFDLSENRRRPGLLLSDEELDAITWTIGDIADTEAVAGVVERHRVGAIIHLAALQVPFCKADPAAGARANVVGTVNILEAARHQGVRRVSYASSVAAHGMDPEGPYLGTLYGAYKACDEMIARVYFQDWEVPSVGIRPGVVYGIGRDQGMTSKTTMAILAAVSGQAYEVPFTGTVSYLYAGEVAAAFVQAVSRDAEGASVFDCNGSVATVEQGLDTVRALVPGAQLHAVGDPLPFPADLTDHLLRDFIGDYGSISMHDGIAETHRAFQTLLQSGKVSADMLA